MQDRSQRGVSEPASRSRHRGRRAVASAALALVAAGSSCAPEVRPVVVITTAGLTPDVQSIRATATLGGQTDSEIYTMGLGQFGMRLPAGASGVLMLALDGLRADACAVASGSGSVSVGGQSRADVTITLAPLDTPRCSGADLGGPTFPLTVTKAVSSGGAANGLITSTPAGISCGATCTAPFAQGTAVGLDVSADYGSLFTGWSGGCTASGGTCQTTVNSATQATATFTATTCSADRLCLKLPAPLPTTQWRAVWGTSAKNLWVVGAKGAVMHWDGAVFASVASGVTVDLYSIWGSSANDFWVGGAGGQVLRWNGSAFTPLSTGGTQNVMSIWGSGANDVYFADRSTSLQHWNGAAFVPFDTKTGVALYGVWGSSANNFWMIGPSGQVLQWNGSNFLVSSVSNAGLLLSIWGSAANDIWTVGGSSQGGMSAIAHYDGSHWTTISSTIPGLLFSVSVAPGDVWAVGTSGGLWHYNGTSFVSATSANSSNLNGAWGVGANDMWAVGDAGTIVRHEP